MKNETIIKSIQKQLETAGTMLAMMGVTTNIQVYFLTDHEGKKALTKNPLFRFQSDKNLISSPKKYDFLDAANPKQIALSINENRTKYLHVEDMSLQRFVVASPITSEEYGVIGSLCFAGSIDPIATGLITAEHFTVIAEALALSLGYAFEILNQDELREISI